MELIDTIDGMTSADYKERFKAEYWQVKIRARKLREMIIAIKVNAHNESKLDPILNCSLDLFEDQLKHMLAYESILKERAKLDGINLD